MAWLVGGRAQGAAVALLLALARARLHPTTGARVISARKCPFYCRPAVPPTSPRTGLQSSMRLCTISRRCAHRHGWLAG